MDTRRYRRKQAKLEYEDLAEEYPHNLSMYTVGPSACIKLNEFEDLAIERLKVLRIIEYATMFGHKIYSPEWKNCVTQELKKQELYKYVRLLKGDPVAKPGDMQMRRDDHISHHILRIAYCRTEELRRWFLAREMELFRLRLMNTSEDGVNAFMRIYNLNYTPVSDEEKMKYRDEINCSTAGHFVLDATTFYKVHFTQVLTLVQQYKVFISGGFAYVPSYEISVCIISQFRSILSEFLASSSKRFNSIQDTRLSYFFENISKAYTGKSYDGGNRNPDLKVNPQNLSQNAKDHFPLCMKTLYDSFSTVHHLKHFSRLQFLFFLKGLGMIFEDVMTYWREEFTKKMDLDKFEKNYSYMVKHTFGKVGRMTSYSPFSCGKIISSSVGPGETHGCPYKHWDVTTLNSKLEEIGINGQNLHDILEAKQAGHYQIACGKFFQAVHGQESLQPINHPNQYFEDSYELKNKSQPTSGTDRDNTKLNDTQMVTQTTQITQTQTHTQSTQGSQI